MSTRITLRPAISLQVVKMKGTVQGSPADKGQNLNLNPGLLTWGFPGGSDGKDSACNVGDLALSWGGKIPCRRERHPTLVFLPGEPQGQRGLTGYSPWSHEESDTTEQRTLPFLLV